MLIHFTGAFLVGLLLGAYLPYLPLTISVVLVLVAVGVTFLESKRVYSCRIGLLVYAGVLLGVLYWIIAADKPVSSMPWSEGEPQQIIGTVVEPVKYSPGREVLTLAVSHAESIHSTRSSNLRLRVTWHEPDRPFLLGDRVKLVAKVHAPVGLHNPGGFDYAESLERHGIHGIATVMGPRRVMLVSEPPAWSWWRLWHCIDEWRDRIREAATHALGDPALGLFLGMVVGMAGSIPSSVRDIFMATGTVHILSISGSHLGLIAFLCFFLVRATCKRLPARSLLALSRWMVPSRLAAVTTVVPVTFYTLLAGAEVATVRSWIMIMILLLAVWLGRRQHLLTALATAALAILVHDPDALFDISFQLSYLSVLAIALTVRWYEDQEYDDAAASASTWVRIHKWGRDYMLMTTGVTVATMPLVAYHFNQIAWLGVLGNLIALPLAGFVLVPLGLASTVWMLLTEGTTLPMASAIEHLFNLLAIALEWLSRVPGAEWHVASPTVFAMLIFYGLVYLLANPGSRGVYRITGTIGVIALIVVWCWSPRLHRDGQTVRVTFLDVGQGDASVIELPNGQTVLIDGGGAYGNFDLGQAVVGPFLWDRGVRRIDHVIATHPQRDHVGGLPWVLRKFQTGQYWGSQVTRTEPFFRRLTEVAEQQGLSEGWAGAGQTILSAGACRLQALNPPSDIQSVGATTARTGKQLNNHSVVTRLDCGAQSFLFAADVEMDALDWMIRSGGAASVRVLKVPHHGSKGSVDEEWIRRLCPEVAVISVGTRNQYGHPARETIVAYERLGVRVVRTDRDGAISITAGLASSTLSVQTVRDSMPSRLTPRIGSFGKERRNLLLIGAKWSGWDI